MLWMRGWCTNGLEDLHYRMEATARMRPGRTSVNRGRERQLSGLQDHPDEQAIGKQMKASGLLSLSFMAALKPLPIS
jgi:hypothetical protein